MIAISAPWATASMLESFLDRPGVADLFEIPRECVVAAVVRG